MNLLSPSRNRRFVNIPINSTHYLFHGWLQMGLAGANLALSPGTIPTEMLMAMSGMMMSSGSLMLARHHKIQEDLKRLSQKNLYFVTNKWMKESSPDPSKLYVGKGFLWSVDSAQKYHQLMNLPSLQHVVDLEPEGGGRLFIHNLGIEDETDRFEELPEHSLIIGTTGVGKTQTVLMQVAQMIEKGEPVIIVDPKGDRNLLDGVYSACVSSGRADDFQFFSLVHPLKSATLDLFANCLRSNDVADRIRSLVATTGGADTSDPFINFCWGIVQATADLMMMITEKVTPRSLYRYIVTSKAVLYEKGLARLEICKDAKERANLQESLAHYKSRVMEYDQVHSEKMSAILIPILTVLGRGEVGALLSPDVASIQLPDIINNKRVTYLYLSSMTDAFSAAAVGKLIVQDVLGHVGQEYAYKRSLNGLNLVVDETYSVIFPGYIDLLNKARQAGLKLTMVMQTSADVAAMLGETVTAQVLGNTTNYFCMRVPEQKFAELISERSGSVNVPVMVKTRAISAGMDKADNLFRSSHSERMDMQSVPLVAPDQLMSLPRGEAFLMTKGGIILKLRIPMLDRSNCQVESFFDMLNPDIGLGPVRDDDTPRWEYTEPVGIVPEGAQARKN